MKTGWLKAAECWNSCVEVQRDGEVIRIRESDKPDVVVETSLDNWRLFFNAVKLGQFDHLNQDADTFATNGVYHPAPAAI